MKEYIEREAALSAQNKSMNLAECRKRLERLPAADVAPVVRCGECKYWTESSVIPNIGNCPFTPIRHTAEFFCANGERKDGDGDETDAL